MQVLPSGVLFPQSEMRAVFVVVANILREQAFQVAFVNCDDVIQEITAATPYATLCDSTLPRTFERGADRTHAQRSNRCQDFQSLCIGVLQWLNCGRSTRRATSIPLTRGAARPWKHGDKVARLLY